MLKDNYNNSSSSSSYAILPTLTKLLVEHKLLQEHKNMVKTNDKDSRCHQSIERRYTPFTEEQKKERNRAAVKRHRERQKYTTAGLEVPELIKKEKIGKKIQSEGVDQQTLERRAVYRIQKEKNKTLLGTKDFLKRKTSLILKLNQKHLFLIILVEI